MRDHRWDAPGRLHDCPYPKPKHLPLGIFIGDCGQAPPREAPGLLQGAEFCLVANSVYEEGLKMSREMAPCVQGFKDMFTIGYPAEIQKYKPTDFYDESFFAELKKSGFIDNVFKPVK